MKTTTPKAVQVALLEERGWTRVDRNADEWVHERVEGAVYSRNAAYRRELRVAERAGS